MVVRKRTTQVLRLVVAAGLAASFSSATAAWAGSLPYRGLGFLSSRVSVGGDFNDTIVLTGSNVVVDVPSISDFWGLGVRWGGYQLPESGFASGAELGGFRGTTSAPGVLAPPGGYDASLWTLYLDWLPAFWLPIGSTEGSFGLSLAGRLGLGAQFLGIKDSAVDMSGSVDARYNSLRLRYGLGMQAKLGATKPFLVSVEWIVNRGSFYSVKAGGKSIDLQDSLGGTTTDIMVGVSYMFISPI